MEEVHNYIIGRMRSDDMDHEMTIQDEQNSSTISPIKKKIENIDTVYSPSEEIKIMKELFDCGILSQEEFERAKNKLIDKL